MTKTKHLLDEADINIQKYYAFEVIVGDAADGAHYPLWKHDTFNISIGEKQSKNLLQIQHNQYSNCVATIFQNDIINQNIQVKEDM